MNRGQTPQRYTMRPWEWIVGVFAVGLLAAVLLPVYAGDHKPRRDTQALSGVKHLTFVSILYAQDYDGFVPQFGHFTTSDSTSAKKVTGDQLAWKAALKPYAKSDETFYIPNWPFINQKGETIKLVRGETNNGSSFGYTENLTAKVVGSPNGLFVLNIATPPAELIEAYGSVAEVPLLEDLAWTVDKWFGQKEIQRSSQKPGRRVVGRMDGSAKLLPVND